MLGSRIMEPSTSPLRSARSPAPIALALAGLLLVILTAWALTETTNRTGSAVVGRVDPDSVYDPVVAGERLPDGFRQLLPRDGIPPVYDPTFVEASATFWPDSTHVIGVALGDGAKAYPVSFLNGRELVVDRLAGIPIVVTW